MKKHSKLKNTGLLYELLSRQVTAEIMDGKPPVAAGLIRQYFHGTELAREYSIYRSLATRSIGDVSKAAIVLESAKDSFAAIDRQKINQEKYKLIKRIDECYDRQDFFGARVNNYKFHASVYHLLESYAIPRSVDASTLASSKLFLLESMTTQPEADSVSEIVEHYRTLDTLSQKFVLESMYKNFRKDYADMNPRALRVLMEYMKNGGSSPKLATALTEELSSMRQEIQSLTPKVDDEATRIKLNEVLNQIPASVDKLRPTLADVTQVLRHVELLDELKNLVNA